MTNSIARLRRNRHLTRRVCAVWLLAWLQTVLVPCTMAMDVMGQRVAEAALVMEHQLPVAEAASGHAAVPDVATDDMDDCVQCPPELDAGDNQDQRCAYPRAPQVDVRGSAQLHADGLIFQTAFTEVIWSAAVPASEAGLLARYITPLPKTRPIALTYCVQLK